jgi:DNA-binding CsgD family transcriptional regulator
MLTITLREMASGTSNDPKVALILSPTELRVASLIRGGFSTEEIAGQLFISQNTVRTHRRNIRRKLKLGGAGQNLRSYLLSKSPSGVTEGGVSGKQDSEFR